MSRSNLTELIADVEEDLSQYADAGLLDRASMYKYAERAIRRLGNDITEVHDKVVEVKNGVAKIPANFKSLVGAYLCSPAGYEKGPEVEEHTLLGSHMYVERVTNGSTWNECKGCCKTHTENVITENLYFKKVGSAKFYYDRPVLLKLGRTFHRSNCAKNCRNKMIYGNPYEINIVDYTLKANFNNGHIYLIYNGIPQDEDGNITYPITSSGHVEEYVEYAIKYNTAEQLIGKGVGERIKQMYPIYRDRFDIARKKAKNHVRMNNLTPDSFRRIQRLNQYESLQYESALTDKSGWNVSLARPRHTRS